MVTQFKNILTVSQLNQTAQRILENHFADIWVEGEISNLSRPSSGHFYFSLKDKTAQVRCAMFRNQSLRLPFEPRAGLLVQVKAKVSIYPDRGDFQLIIESMEIAGDGQLRLAYEQLVRTLSEKGLFQEHLKKPLPTFPRRVGVITSPTGAAIRDILTVLKRRFPLLPITIYPTKVQGTSAAPEIVQAIQIANQHAACDVIILARGGGSLEDLWPFNEEMVAYAIFESKIPIVTGIGHEVDFTIADFVADKRAATPSAAAELVSIKQEELRQHFMLMEKRLFKEFNQRLNFRFLRLDEISKRLRHPRERIASLYQRLESINNRLILCIRQCIKNKQGQFISATRTLEAISPLATLGRGYAIVSSEKIIRSVSEVESGDTLNVRLQDGMFNCQVT